MRNFILTPIFALILFSVTAAPGAQNSSENKNYNYLDEFKAKKIVTRLSRKNLKDIKFMESISLKYGYKGYVPVKKEYYSAKMEVIRGNLVLAGKMLETNKKNIETVFKKISEKFSNRSSGIINHSVSMISAYHIDAYESKDPDKIKKFNANQLRIEVAIKQQKSGDEAKKNHSFRTAIKHYRKAKSIAIKVLKRLSGPEESKKITEKYSIDMKDYGTDHF